ncbi:hypothetical protein [Enterovibrio norvegicus]|uniref:Uncharacterized protein n=1 Tax=Enterovibrio norvegicus DSM 15893 TaxID=1121869 RepID=A0A1I5PVV1_9GAMM|nr:hypothetical protein [Enterovibrio norvegicus]OEE49620.1 hypothetical protein A1OS_00495 [Enterovibrio norvegicus]SFP37781.1 hypothetical protein SAMN03084138_02050 [Enterovibrio norvegicus DSM 15893]
MEYDIERKGIFRVKHIGHSFTWTGGDSHSYTLGHALGINIGSKEAFTIGLDMSFKLAAVLDISFGVKREFTLVKKWKNASFVESTSIKDNKLTKEYSLTTKDKTETIDENKLYIGYNAVKDVNVNIFDRKKAEENKNITKPIGQFLTIDKKVKSHIYINGSEEKNIGGNEKKDIAGDIIYTSTRGDIQLEANIDIIQKAKNILLLKADQGLYTLSEGNSIVKSKKTLQLEGGSIYIKTQNKAFFV